MSFFLNWQLAYIGYSLIIGLTYYNSNSPLIVCEHTSLIEQLTNRCCKYLLGRIFVSSVCGLLCWEEFFVQFLEESVLSFRRATSIQLQSHRFGQPVVWFSGDARWDHLPNKLTVVTLDHFSQGRKANVLNQFAVRLRST